MVGDEVETGRLRDCEALRFATSLRSEGPRDPGTGRRLRSFTLRNFIEELGCRRIKQPGHHCEALRFATSLRKHESMAVIIAMARLRSFTLRNFIEDTTTRGTRICATALRSFTLRNFIEEENGVYTFNGDPTLRSFTLRNFIEEANAAEPEYVDGLPLRSFTLRNFIEDLSYPRERTARL